MSVITDATTTLKLETCSFTEMKIYPGRSRCVIARDGRSHMFINKRVHVLFLAKIKPAKLTWTQAWRRNHRKGRVAISTGKKRTKKTVKVQKAFVGMSLDEMQRIRAEIANLPPTDPKAPRQLPAK